MDIQMPIIDGYQAVRELRDKGYKKPVYALTAYAFDEDRRESLLAGFDGHISKPIDTSKLLGLLAPQAR
jgi:CheY-like chemotaxis protein